MAVQGYAALIRRSGTSTAIEDEACEQISGKLYQITSSARRVIDPSVDWTFSDSTAMVPYADIVSLDYVNGQVTFASTPVGDVTFSGNYLPLSTSSEVFAGARSFTLSENTDLLDITEFTGSTEPAVRARLAGLKDASVEVESIATPAQLTVLDTHHAAGTPLVVEIYQGSAAAPRFRGFCLIENIERSGSVGDLIVSNVSFKITTIENETSGLVASYSYKTQP